MDEINIMQSCIFNYNNIIYRDIWTIILTYVGVKEMAKMTRINKFFNEIIKSQQYLNNLAKLDKHILFGHACKYGKYQYVKTVMSIVDPSFADNYCIKIAVTKEHLEVVNLLLNDNRVDSSVDNQCAIRTASENGHIEVVKLLLNDNRVDPSVDNQYAIQWASNNGHIEVVKLLLNDPQVDPSADNQYAIRWASSKGHVEVVKLLLNDQRVDPSANNQYAIQWASEKGYIEVVKLLLNDQRVDPSVDNQYAIRFASQNGDTEVVKLLLNDPRVDPLVCFRYRLNGSITELLEQSLSKNPVKYFEWKLKNKFRYDINMFYNSSSILYKIFFKCSSPSLSNFPRL